MSSNSEAEKVWTIPCQNVRWFELRHIAVEKTEITPLNIQKAKYKVTYEKITVKPKSSKHEEELQVLLSLQNENILRFLGTSDTYFIYQKCEVSLDYVIREATTFTTHDAYGVVLNIAQALSYLHSQGYIHRDICRQNIVFTEKNDGQFFEAKLACLETVCKYTEDSKEKNKLPSFRNLPLEWPLTPKSDVWSLGIVTLEMFTRWTDHKSSYQQPTLLHSDLKLNSMLQKNAAERPTARKVVKIAAKGFEQKDVQIVKPASKEQVWIEEMQRQSWLVDHTGTCLLQEVLTIEAQTKSRSADGIQVAKLFPQIGRSMSKSGTAW